MGSIPPRPCQLDAAEAGYRQALAAAAPNVPGLTDIIYCTLGNVLAAQDKLAEAVAAYRQAISIKPNNVEAYCRLGDALLEHCKPVEAAAAYCQAISIEPAQATNIKRIAFSKSLFHLHYDYKLTNDQLFAAHREWGERYAQQVPIFTTYDNDRSASRRLRIGYVSPDFRQHSVAHFVEPLLRAHDRRTPLRFARSVDFLLFVDDSRHHVVLIEHSDRALYIGQQPGSELFATVVVDAEGYSQLDEVGFR